MNHFLNRWIFGYVVLQMWGKYVERFINLAIKSGLEVWDIKRLENDKFQIKLKVKDFFRLKPILRETGTRMSILRKIGLPFLVYKINRRKGIAIGFFLFILLLYMLSSMIWRIDVIGTEKIPKSEVLNAAEQVGIKIGAFKWRLDQLEDLQYELQKSVDDASWIGIKFDGVVVKITVVEKVRSEQPKTEYPRHLVAKKKAVIQKYTAEKGQPKIAVHQLVNKGDILISGIIGPEGEPNKQKLVSAQGKVWGEVWYDSTISIPLRQEVSKLTGKSKTSHYILLGKYAIKIWGFGKKDEIKNYKTEENQEYLTIRNHQWPIGWKRKDTLEVEKEYYQLTEEEAVKTALEIGRKDLINKVGGESKIKGEKVLQQWVEHGKVYLKVHYTVIEEISMEAPLAGQESRN